MKYLAAFFAGMLTMFAAFVLRVKDTACAKCGAALGSHYLGCPEAPWSARVSQKP